MNIEEYPLLVVPAVPNNSSIKFLHFRDSYEVDNLVEEIWQIISLCTGRWSVKHILTKITKQFPKLSETDVKNILDDLESIDVIVECRKAFSYLHSLTQNPMSFVYNMSHNETLEYTQSPRIPVMNGEKIPISVEENQLTSLQFLRRSCRSFDKDYKISFNQVGQILASSYSIHRHSAPSAGGLYPLKIFLIVPRNGKDLKEGYYEYNPENESLVLYNKNIDKEILQYAFNNTELLDSASVIVVIAADFERQVKKYSNRGYRLTLIEAGHIAQNISLAAPIEKLSSLEYGGFLDNILASELGIADKSVSPIITIGIGKETTALDSTISNQLEEMKKMFVGKNKPVSYVRLSFGNQPEKGETFFGANAFYKAPPHQNARKSTRQRFAGGTATSSDLAQIKSIAEAFERYASGLVRYDLIDSAENLQYQWLDPRDIVPLTDEQYKKLSHLKPFSVLDKIEWIKGERLDNNSDIYVPIDIVFYPLSGEILGRNLIYSANSSGIAAYTDKSKAIEKGLLELIERDAIMRNWFTRKAPNLIAYNNLPIHWQKRVDYWNTHNRQVYIFDLSDHGVSTISVAIVSEDFPCFMQGASSSIASFEEALSKAFHESESMLLHSLLAGKRSNLMQPEKVDGPIDHAILYSYPKHLDNLSWMWDSNKFIEPSEPTAALDSLFSKFEAIAVDLTPDSYNLHVIRVISPKLIPINFGFQTEHYTHRSINKEDIDSASLCLPHYFA